MENICEGLKRIGNALASVGALRLVTKQEKAAGPRQGAIASSEPYTHLIGLGDFAPEGRRKLAPGKRSAARGLRVYKSMRPGGAQEALTGSVQRPSGARLCVRRDRGRRFACPRLISFALSGRKVA